MKKIGVILLVLGVLLSVYSGFNFITKEKVVDIGDIQITADKKHNVVWSPILGIALLVIGGGVLLFGSSKK
ncbi:MAG: hypothetical protein COW03_06635 [Cytophagales bacterium CG12_big_fil_rev_8_21_14_0_65_40_12]|nr:MAG: hypothetical protein COW03_06635 [Cytophagales bacterium CG12_big_fil_rev_8_21_14_0_65_40_12]PIW03319.1 MAG: hypothetical protein COW40_15790 [Cytophagales bacterium CG17_big_fil_post_rev_8_21_14_2_50_40_13]